MFIIAQAQGLMAYEAQRHYLTEEHPEDGEENI